MELTTIILASVLGTIAALVSMVVTLVLCYLYWKKRSTHKSKGGELEPLQVGPNAAPSTNQQGGSAGEGSVVELTRHNVEDRQQPSGPLRLIPPLVTTVALQAVPLNSKEKEGGGAMSFLSSLIPGAEELEEMAMDLAEGTESAGQIHFSLEYDFKASTLILKIMQARDIPAKDLLGTSDPYVRVCLLPDKKNKLETKVKHRTLNPRWNETFYFEGFPMLKLQKSTLHLHVFDYDRFSRDDSIGEVFLPLNQVDFTQKPSFWKTLKPTEKLGEILLSLLYVPRTSEFALTVIKCRNLKVADITGSSDPYVKVWLHRGDKRIEKKKTRVIKTTLNPVFNDTFQFVVPWEHIRETSLSVTVMDYDQIGRNEMIGKVVLSSRSGPTEAKHWADMLSKPRTPVPQWHRLKSV